MEELGILSQPFVSSVDIMFLVVAGWVSKDLANFPPDMIRSLVELEVKRKENIDKFRQFMGSQKMATFRIAPSADFAMAA